MGLSLVITNHDIKNNKKEQNYSLVGSGSRQIDLNVTFMIMIMTRRQALHCSCLGRRYARNDILITYLSGIDQA